MDVMQVCHRRILSLFVSTFRISRGKARPLESGERCLPRQLGGVSLLQLCNWTTSLPLDLHA